MIQVTVWNEYRHEKTDEEVQKMLDFLSKSKHCEWVDEQLLKTYHNVSRLEDLKIKKPKLKYLADYICLLNYIEKLDILVMKNGIVGSNTHKPLDTKEFRGFAI